MTETVVVPRLLLERCMVLVKAALQDPPLGIEEKLIVWLEDDLSAVLREASH